MNINPCTEREGANEKLRSELANYVKWCKATASNIDDLHGLKSETSFDNPAFEPLMLMDDSRSLIWAASLTGSTSF